MPKQTPYSKGRRKEYEAMTYMEQKHSCKCIRSAGSHKPADLLCGDGRKRYAIQVKYGKKPAKVNIDELIKFAWFFDAIPLIMQKQPRKEWELKYV